MTDRELLELAAKAAGIEVAWDESTECFWTTDGYDSFVPLIYDADAFRLAVTLNIHITSSPTDAWASTLLETAIEPKGSDPFAATRRAIVRVAAAIGKGM